MFNCSFFCYFPGGNVTRHTQRIDFVDIPLWISSYLFTHPSCKSISVKVWFNDDGEE